MGARKKAASREFSQPLISVDVVPVWVENGRVLFGLGARQYEPFKGALALPGVLMGRERSLEAALRALKSKVGIEAPRLLRDIGVFDAAERDPRGPTLSIAKVALLNPDEAASARREGTLTSWSLNDAAQDTLEPQDAALPFDHDGIVRQARQYLAGALWSDSVLTRGLLGERFTTREATGVHRDLTGDVSLHPSNVRRRLAALDGLESSDEVVSDGQGRPSTAWTWSEPWGVAQ